MMAHHLGVGSKYRCAAEVGVIVCAASTQTMTFQRVLELTFYLIGNGSHRGALATKRLDFCHNPGLGNPATMNPRPAGVPVP